MRRTLVATLAVLALWAAVGCSDAPPATPPEGQTHADDRAPAPTADDPYAKVVDAIEVRGSERAAEAWAAGRPALLLFAASW